MTPHTPKTHTPTAHHYPLNTHMHTTRHMFTHKNILVPDHNMHIYTTAMTHTHTHTHTCNKQKTLKTSGLNTTNSWQHTVNTWTMKTWHTQGIKLTPQHNWKHGHTSITHEPARQSDSQQLKTETHNWNTLKDDNTHAHNNKMATAYKVKLNVDTHRTMNTYQMGPITHINCQPTYIKQWEHTNLQAEHQPHITTATD